MNDETDELMAKADGDRGALGENDERYRLAVADIQLNHPIFLRPKKACFEGVPPKNGCSNSFHPIRKHRIRRWLLSRRSLRSVGPKEWLSLRPHERLEAWAPSHHMCHYTGWCFSVSQPLLAASIDGLRVSFVFCPAMI